MNANPITSDANVDLDTDNHTEDDLDDPFKAIIAEEVKNQASEIETMREALGEGDTEPSARRDEGTSPEDDKAASAEGTAESDDEAKRPGVDDVLREVEDKLGTDHADVMRGILTQYHGTRADMKDMQLAVRERLLELEEALAETKNPQEPEQHPAADPRLEAITPEQWELFDMMAAQNGYVKQQELDDQALIQGQDDFIQQDIAEGIERWGAKFGKMGDDGGLEFNAIIKPDVQDNYRRITDPGRGISSQDLYKITQYDADVAAAREGREEQAAEQRTNKTVQARRAITESRAAPGGRTQPSVRKEGDSLEDVIARSSAIAWREI